MTSVLNIAAYRFVPIDEPSLVVDRVRGLCEALELRGSVLVAPEGINIFLAGAADAVHEFIARFGEDERFSGLTIRFSESGTIPFKRLRVKLKREIITFRKHEIAPGATAGRADSLTPAQLRDWLRRGRDDQGRELVLLDTRNRQEVAFGSFQGALTLPIERFTELPEALELHREQLRGKTVVSFCTGGIRCEKAALWMSGNGYDNVLQLEGGILGYFEQVGAEGYDGGCFVFDQRVALDPQLRPLGP